VTKVPGRLIHKKTKETLKPALLHRLGDRIPGAAG